MRAVFHLWPLAKRSLYFLYPTEKETNTKIETQEDTKTNTTYVQYWSSAKKQVCLFLPQTKIKKRTKIEIKTKTNRNTKRKRTYFQYWSPAKKYVCLFFPQTKAASSLGRSSGSPRSERGRPRSEKREKCLPLEIRK